MAFIEIIDFHTSRMDEGPAHVEESLAVTEGRRTSRRDIPCQDRNDRTHDVNIVMFDSYESAMESSNLTETGELAARLVELADGSSTFLDLDVVDERE